MTNDTIMLLINTRKETRYIDKINQRNVERITETDKPCGFVGSIDIQTAGHYIRLVGDNAYAAAVKTREAADNVRSEMFMTFVELSVSRTGAPSILLLGRKDNR